MTIHLTARLAWHDDGWNGRVCRKPDCNTYCVGAQSYPGNVVFRERRLAVEEKNAGRPIAQLAGADLPPCIYSANAFGDEGIRGYSNPPDFFRGGAKRTEWDIPPATVCVWPYEAMYGDAVYDETGKLDNDKRSANAEEFFSKIENDKSLVFYYANYSNPLSDDESPRYVLIGVSRVKKVGARLSYDEANDYIRQHYAGGMIWGRNISSHYPDTGLRLPYHRYRDDPEALNRFAVFPENPRTCKYGARLLTNDDAIGLLEQFLSAVRELKVMSDDSEDWIERERWLLGCIAELWSKRGLYPGLLNVMRFLDAEVAITKTRELAEAGKAREAHSLFFQAVEKNTVAPELGLTGKALQKLSRQWRLKPPDAQMLLKEVLPRLDLDIDQIERIVSEEIAVRSAHGLPESIKEPLENPYVLCEGYVGNSPDDIIPWGRIDRGTLPSPELGGDPLAEMDFDDARRLRALCVEQLRREPNQTFRAADNILGEVNTRLARLPEWKSASFTARYLEVDREVLEQALVLRSEGQRLWLYLKRVFEDERDVEDALTRLAGRAAISLARPFTIDDWRSEIIDKKSRLLAKTKDEYLSAAQAQADACAAIFARPLAIVTGAAGTGKTSAICALIRAVRQTEGDGAPLTVLAPTGKASDRIRAKLHEREIERVSTSTVHSFLAKGGWLNDNLTLKQKNGKLAGAGTVIVDEASMLDLGLMASLVRALDWRQVRRFILVGDPNQLPPIGRGRVFADTIRWLSEKQPGSVARLHHNLRQMENRAEGRGTAILRLADLFVGGNAREEGDSTSPEAEALLSAVHKGGDVDADLRVIYWDEATSIAPALVAAVEQEMSTHTGTDLVPDKPYELWRAAFDWKPEKYQVLTPHRGELHGVDAINQAIQERIARGVLEWYGSIDGITLYDKVIQYRNRPQSNPIWAYNFATKRPERVEVFNGEIGFVQKHNFDKGSRFRLKRFQVKFERKDHLAVGYGSDLSANGGFESVEENLELAYAISVHKAQGSEFNHTYVVVPRSKGQSLSSELLYTALTRATQHSTLLIQGDVSTLLSARRPENAQLGLINSSLFDGFFRAVPDELIRRHGWYEEGKIHQALTSDMVRSKSELVISNLLHDRGVPFQYEVLLRAPDGTMYLPDFTITWNGETWYWEHWGMMSSDAYQRHRETKVAWYSKHFPGRLVETFEAPTLSQDAAALIERRFSA
jgi:ATP-dependent exoDNAse (exonuclease V) alpha subunit